MRSAGLNDIDALNACELVPDAIGTSARNKAEAEENQKKQHDLKNRVLAAQSFENPIFISIHANKFYLTSCKGAQVFYGTSPLSISLADSIQNSIRIIQKDNKRVTKDGTKTVYNLERLQCPSVLVETGFLTNYVEGNVLANPSYQHIIGNAVAYGIMDYFS